MGRVGARGQGQQAEPAGFQDLFISFQNFRPGGGAPAEHPGEELGVGEVLHHRHHHPPRLLGGSEVEGEQRQEEGGV